jgi:hypothetical protein
MSSLTIPYEARVCCGSLLTELDDDDYDDDDAMSMIKVFRARGWKMKNNS